MPFGNVGELVSCLSAATFNRRDANGPQLCVESLRGRSQRRKDILSNRRGHFGSALHFSQKASEDENGNSSIKIIKYLKQN
jgi:hypothetical protein